MFTWWKRRRLMSELEKLIANGQVRSGRVGEIERELEELAPQKRRSYYNPLGF